MFSKKILLASIACLCTTPALAMLCPNNFNEINIGDTLDHVKEQCGPPDTEKTVDGQANIPQEWVYFIQVAADNTATLRTTVAFANGKVSNLSANGTSLASTTICAGNTVSIGDTEESVKTACGKPALINQGNLTPAAVAALTPKIVDVTYGSPAVTLEFVNGVLKTKQ